MKNNPQLKGRSKKYNHSRNIDHLENIYKLRITKTVSCLNIHKNKSSNNYLINNEEKNNIYTTRNKKKHNLSIKYNKSSNCVTPSSFNPLINYEIKENKIGNKKMNLLNKNNDHFNNMNPTELYTYKP